MNRNAWRTPVIATVTAVLLCTVVGPVLAAPPKIERGSFTETFADDFLFDLCGIRTQTTLTQRWSVKTSANGSESVHVVRTFVPADRRLPVEKAAGVTFVAPDGSRRVVGKPIQLIGPRGVRLLDAGWVAFDADGSVSTVRGPHPSLDANLADFYCPS